MNNINTQSVVFDIVNKRNDVSDVCLDEESNQVYFNGGPDFFDKECIFDSCSNDVAAVLLRKFLNKEISMGWSVSCELSKLLAKRGGLVAEIAEPIVTEPREKGFSERFLFLSYFANSIVWEPFCIDFLDWVPEDGRDGLFLACYMLNTPRIYVKLTQKFSEGMMADAKWGGGTGEGPALERFVAKWDGCPNFTSHDNLREALRSACWKREGQS